jgi:hypothetical protein
MTGVFPANVQHGLATVSGTAGPATQNNIGAVPAGDAQATVAAAGDFAVPYTLQTGEIRYAPMPPVAPTKITAKRQSRQWPTSAYTVYAAAAGPPNAVTTVTQALTFIVSSVENTVYPPCTSVVWQIKKLTLDRLVPLNSLQTPPWPDS